MLTASSKLALSALESAPDAMIIVDAAGLICFVNRQVSALFGYSRDEIIGRPIECLLPERFRGGHAAHRHDYASNMRIRPMGSGLDLFGQRRDSTEFPVEISLSPITDGGQLLVAAAIRDVTDRKRVEAELVVARLAAERARESADRANREKGRFLAMASHDLRQPLQALSLLSGVLRRGASAADTAQVLAQQEQAINAMSRLLNALLDISKLESGAIEPQTADFAVGGLLQELRREFAELAASKGLTLSVESGDGQIHSDRSLVEQILKNLLSNAIKYTRQGGVVLRCAHEPPASVRIEVLDTGIGIPADKLHFIYDEFYQVEPGDHGGRDGYGLGLSIVQRLVALLDLKLDVESEVGKGSRFSLTLPAGHGGTSRSRPGAKPRLRKPPGQARVLLVEDDASVRNATRMLLRSEGYQVTAVASLAEALRHAGEDPGLQLLVTDYHLGDGETGWQVIAAVREALRRPIGAVLITGDTTLAASALPADRHLRMASKPVKAEELLAMLGGLLRADD